MPPTRRLPYRLGQRLWGAYGDAHLHTQRLNRYDYPLTLHHRVLRDPWDGLMGPFPTVSDGAYEAPMKAPLGRLGVPFPTVSDDLFLSMTMSLPPAPFPPSWGSPLFGHPRDPLTISGLIT
jgi:hypothetical protein